MATTELTTLARTRVRVPMVVPPFAMVMTAVADLRATPDADAELVDQLHYKEMPRVLGMRGDWHFVQAADGYFGWIDARGVELLPGAHGGRLVGTALAPIYSRPNAGAAIVGYLPAGTKLASLQSDPPEGPWVWVNVRDPGRPDGGHKGFVSLDDAASRDDLPHRPPTASDLIATAEAFLGTPYLWGGTSALGLDCSGLVQQVYRLNGVGLPRDADQQALAGRAVSDPRPGDLLFFGTPHVTHVALSLGGDDLIHAPQRGAFVERSRIGERQPVAIRRYLAEQ